MLKAAAIFSDNMVLQRGKNVTMWGECDEAGTVAAEINGCCGCGNGCGCDNNCGCGC